MKRKIKKEILKTLENNPIAESACKRHGISRQTFYRWQKEDPEFKRKAEEAQSLSHDSITDMAESQLFKKIAEGSMSAIRLRLTTHSDRYRPARRRNPTEEEPRREIDSYQRMMSETLDQSSIDPKIKERVLERRKLNEEGQRAFPIPD